MRRRAFFFSALACARQVLLEMTILLALIRPLLALVCAKAGFAGVADAPHAVACPVMFLKVLILLARVPGVLGSGTCKAGFLGRVAPPAGQSFFGSSMCTAGCTDDDAARGLLWALSSS